MTPIKATQVEYGDQPLPDALAERPVIKATYSGAWAPTAVVAGGSLALNVTVTGAAVGDIVLCSFTSILGDGILKAQVTATNTVTVTLHNLGTGSLSLASGTLRLKPIGA